MPLFTNIEPVCVSREKIGDNLEQNAGGTLSRIILQLSNLSLRGSQLIEALLEEISRLNKRYKSIQNRIDSMNGDIDKLDAKVYSQTSVVVVYNKRKKPHQYKPVLVRETLPQSLKDQYNRCEPPPPFKLIFADIPVVQGDCQETQERIKFYSNISYFKDSWCEQKKQMKIKKRITRNKLLKLQTSKKIIDLFQKDDKFYPVPIHQVKHRATETLEKPQTSPIKQESPIPTAIHDENQYEYPSFCMNTSQDTEPDATSELGREQGSYNDDSSIIYEIFAPAEMISSSSSQESNTASTRDTGNDQITAMVPILSIEDNIGTKKSETLVNRRILPLKDRSDVTRKESAVKDLLKSFVLERRRFIKSETSSGSNDYSEESSTDSDDSSVDSED